MATSWRGHCLLQLQHTRLLTLHALLHAPLRQSNGTAFIPAVAISLPCVEQQQRILIANYTHCSSAQLTTTLSSHFLAMAKFSGPMPRTFSVVKALPSLLFGTLNSFLTFPDHCALEKSAQHTPARTATPTDDQVDNNMVIDQVIEFWSEMAEYHGNNEDLVQRVIDSYNTRRPLIPSNADPARVRAMLKQRAQEQEHMDLDLEEDINPISFEEFAYALLEVPDNNIFLAAFTGAFPNRKVVVNPPIFRPFHVNSR
ncbi:predicted protein [Lichtheimia corymbifera JMRC:FSU:9682]|uniref:Uncharacterized protein n=1 Tax=Lichtheimia corymbifera JMRC:FSU:9682 TaxID=1263082 RepID=A0A068RUX5_9FUNG|nr:predicted protein [Lichtheimia corymbifera JMRC:FSU:9682]